MNPMIGQIWRSKAGWNHFLVFKHSGNLFGIRRIDTKEEKWRPEIHLKKYYSPVRNCVYCGSARIKYRDPIYLSETLSCWSCDAN